MTETRFAGPGWRQGKRLRSVPTPIGHDPASWPPGFFAAFTSRATALRALKVSSIVGTLLTTINHGDLIFMGQMPAPWKVMLTYLVPYLVSSYSSASLLAGLRRSFLKEQGIERP